MLVWRFEFFLEANCGGAVFLGMGLAGVRALGCEGEALSGVHDAVGFIADLRQADDLSRLAVGRRIVVIGGGNTAIDIAVQTKRLGAEEGPWRLTGLDPDGLDLACGDVTLRLAFAARVTTAAQLRQVVVNLAVQARSG